MDMLDINTVSATHSQITIALAGLAFTILLLAYPILLVRSSETLVDSGRLSTALTFFFYSLAFGILASFEYSVLSGDMRDKTALMITWTFPSLSFAVSLMMLFSGFVHMTDSYSSTEVHLNPSSYSLIRMISVIAIFAPYFFILRTNVESLQLLNLDRPVAALGGFDSLTVLALAIPIALILLIILFSSESLFSDKVLFFNKLVDALKNTKYFFIMLSVVLVYCIIGYALTSVWGFPADDFATLYLVTPSGLIIAVGAWTTFLLRKPTLPSVASE